MSNTVPNVAPKMCPKEQARLQAQIGNLRNTYAQFVIDEEGQTRTLDAAGERPGQKPKKTQDPLVEQGGEEARGKGIDLKKVPTVYFNKCKGGCYTVDHLSSKILIEGLSDTTITIRGKVLTSTVEVWKCSNLTLVLDTPVKTLQLDMLTSVDVQFSKKEHYHAVVWQDVYDLNLSFGDAPQHNLATGFAHMETMHPDNDVKLDQFIVRFLEASDSTERVLTPERCVRLKNGFLSTEREAIDWERRNTQAREAFMANYLKENGLRLNKGNSKKVPPNKPCTCGSNLKYKKCCMNQREVGALAKGQKLHYAA